MNTISVNLPTTLSVSLKHHDKPIVLDLEAIPAEKREELVLWGFEFGVRQSAGDADAGMAGQSIGERRKAVRAKFDKIANGYVPSGGGGGGARLTPETLGWIEFVQAKVNGGVIFGPPNKAKVNGANLRGLQQALMQRDLLASGQATKETVVEIAKANFDAWTKYMEGEDADLKAAIKAQQVLAKGAAAPVASGFKVG